VAKDFLYPFVIYGNIHHSFDEMLMRPAAFKQQNNKHPDLFMDEGLNGI